MVKKTERYLSKVENFVRIQRIELKGSFGDCKPIGDGLNELRISEGKGHRIYYKEHRVTIILLPYGDKSTQNADIDSAKTPWTKYKNDHL